MAEIRTERATWEADPTGAEYSALAPVRLAGRSTAGAFGVQDYLTPGQARELAAQLVATADAVEKAQASDEGTEPL